MLIVIICILILAVSASLVFYLNYSKKKSPKFNSILNYSINSYLVDIEKNALDFIAEFFPSKDVIVIYDDIAFFNPNFHWPKKHLYIHLADINYFSVKLLSYTSSSGEEQKTLYQELYLFLLKNTVKT